MKENIIRKPEQPITWWQAGFVQLISKLSVEAYKQSNKTYLAAKPASDSKIPPERSNRVIPLKLETK